MLLITATPHRHRTHEVEESFEKSSFEKKIIFGKNQTERQFLYYVHHKRRLTEEGHRFDKDHFSIVIIFCSTKPMCHFFSMTVFCESACEKARPF